MEFSDKRYLVVYAYKMSKINFSWPSIEFPKKTSSHLLKKGQTGFDLEI